MADSKKIRLDEVTLMRMILAILIVFMHSFTCYNHSWQEPEGFIEIPAYKWLSRTSFAFTLEAFVFISGYLYAFQRITLKRVGGIALISSKLKRLILPSVLFSIAYFAIFYQYKSISDTIYSILNGCGHMWYLPMLFWCFVGGWLLEQVKIKDIWKILFLLGLNLVFYLSLPLQLSNAASFMIYFYGGFLFYKYSEKIKPAITPKRLVLSWCIFAVVFALLRPLRDVLTLNDNLTIIQKLFVFVGNNACQLVYAWIGLIAFYCTSVYYTQKHELSKRVKKLSACCFGIYLFQQFILQLLYYKTDFPIIVGPYLLPWCGFIIALVISYCLSVLLLKTKTGRFLIG